MSDPIPGIGRATITPTDAADETNTTVWQVQQSLNLVTGRAAVPETGVFESRTRTVLRRFQEQEGLRPNGTINQPTIEALNRRAAAVRREQGTPTDVCRSGEVVADGDSWSATGRACTGPDHRTERGFAGVRGGDRAGVELGLGREQLVLHERRGLRVTAQGEALSARAGVGVRNDDGSRGAHLGAEANLLAGQVAVETPDGESAYFGVSMGPGAGGSVGRHDRDLDGRPETCISVSVGPISAGACWEDESY